MAAQQMIDVSKLSFQTIDQIMAFNNANELEFIWDEVQNGTISNTQEKSDLTGKGGRKIGSLKKNKGVTVTATNGFIVGGALAAQTGTEVEQGKYTVRVSDILTVEGNQATTTYKAVGAAGNEIGSAYRKNENGSLGERLTQDAEAGEGKFKYTPGSKLIELNAGAIDDGGEIVVFYDVTVDGAKISNDSETYSKTLKIYMDVTASDNCDNLYHVQFLIPRGDVSGEFEIAMGDDPAVHNIEIESLAGGCSGSTKLWDCIVYQDIDLGE